jgi:hypothetical protein
VGAHTWECWCFAPNEAPKLLETLQGDLMN